MGVAGTGRLVAMATAGASRVAHARGGWAAGVADTEGSASRVSGVGVGEFFPFALS